MHPNAPSSLFLMSRISPLHSGHCSAMAHRASSSAPWVSGSGSVRHWTSLLRMFLSQPSSRIRMVIHGWARTQLPKAWRLSRHSSAASSHLSSQVRLTFIGPGAELESRAPRRKRRAVEKNRLWPASTEPEGWGEKKTVAVSLKRDSLTYKMHYLEWLSLLYLMRQVSQKYCYEKKPPLKYG